LKCIRSICEGDNSKPQCNIQQDTKKCHKTEYPERKRKEMATSMGGNNERGDYYRIFSKCRKKTRSEFNLKP
jgi:hypothetical protein